jgi:uncharacterized protein YacL
LLRRNLRMILTAAGGLGGLSLMSIVQTSIVGSLASSLGLQRSVWLTVAVLILGAISGGVIGFFLYPLVNWMEARLRRTAFIDIIFGVVGLIAGLLIAALLSLVLNDIPVVGPLLSILTAVVSGYLGLAVATFKREEAAHWIAAIGQRGAKGEGVAREEAALPSGIKGSPKVLDTSVIIDGRIKEILETGFLEGPIIVPSFVLDELRHISDSADLLRRNRGRRGLDILNAIQKDPRIEVRIHDERVGDGMEVDTQLLKVAKRMGGQVVTNDYNLNKVAEFQGVPVLNINELANAVKPAVLPGEEMVVQVIKEGKELGQGVGYLDDGTMIVVDNGKRHLGETIGVVVTSVLQTAAGRMIFAKPKVSAEKVAP